MHTGKILPVKGRRKSFSCTGDGYSQEEQGTHEIKIKKDNPNYQKNLHGLQITFEKSRILSLL